MQMVPTHWPGTLSRITIAIFTGQAAFKTPQAIPHSSHLVVYYVAFYHGSVITTIHGQKIDDMFTNAIRQPSSDATPVYQVSLDFALATCTINLVTRHPFFMAAVKTKYTLAFLVVKSQGTWAYRLES
jgi:hypothetical protein